MDRRAFLRTLGTLYGSAGISAATSPLNVFKLGAISDGFSEDFEQSLQIMKSYGLTWVEIRSVFGIYNTEASPAQIRSLKNALDKYGFRVSVIDSAFYKCTLPGTSPVKSEKETFGYGGQLELLRRACDRAHALGAEKIRVFTFWRVAEPEKISERIAEELRKAAEIAARAGMRLVIENEESCNAATGHELASVLRMVPASNIGANWDVGNGYWEREISFPNGYDALDPKRIWHMHLKDVRCETSLQNCSETVSGAGQIDLVGQFRRLLRDGYHETMSLECEIEDPRLTHQETTRRSLGSLLKTMALAVDRY